MRCLSIRSHPTGVRGLKFSTKYDGGAHVPSHPTGVRGLKSIAIILFGWGRLVAPHWGAWIEINKVLQSLVDLAVAPHWGAWIEILTESPCPRIRPGRTPLGCVD